MTTESATIVQRMWNYCNVLREDGVIYGDYIESQFLVADEIEKELDQALARSERLRQSILKRAFEGRLVGQEKGDWELLPNLKTQDKPRQLGLLGI
jgi:hypothetical protein